MVLKIRRSFHFFVRHGLGDARSFRSCWLFWDWRSFRASLESPKWYERNRRTEVRDRGILGTPFAVGIVAPTASPYARLPPMRHDAGRRRVVAVDTSVCGAEVVADLRGRKSRATPGKMQQRGTHRGRSGSGLGSPRGQVVRQSRTPTAEGDRRPFLAAGMLRSQPPERPPAARSTCHFCWTRASLPNCSRSDPSLGVWAGATPLSRRRTPAIFCHGFPALPGSWQQSVRYAFLGYHSRRRTSMPLPSSFF